MFTAFHGRGYRGNTRVVFEELIARRKLDPIWLSTDRGVVKDVQGRFGVERAALAQSWRGLSALARAQAVMLTHGITDLPWLHLPWRALVIQTWHGLPTKTGELMDPSPSLWTRLRIWQQWHRVDHMLSTSSFVSEIYGKRFGLPRQRFLELGYPLHDELVGKAEVSLEQLFPGAPPAERLIVYAPTFRRRATTRFLPFPDSDLSELGRFLERERAILCLRPHPNDRVDLASILAATPRAVLGDDRLIQDPVALLRRADAVVTDYSGIFLEGLLVDVPAVFVPYDLEEYERGLPWDYASYTPGPKVATFRDFLQALGAALADRRTGAADRQRVREAFFAHADGGATGRMIDWLVQRLAGETKTG